MKSVYGNTIALLILTLPVLVSIQNTSAEESAIIIDERTLLKSYLDEVTKSTDAAKSEVLAKYDLEREIFEEKNNRWWDEHQYDANERARIEHERERNAEDEERSRYQREFWIHYQSGKQAAEQVAAQATAFKLCARVQNFFKKGPFPYRDEETVELMAYKRGVISAYPACFQGDPIEGLRGLEKKIKKAELEIQSVQKQLIQNEPDEAAIQEMAESLKNQIVKMIDDGVRSQVIPLQNLVTPDQATQSKINKIVKEVSNWIQCDTLKSRQGMPVNCAFQWINSDNSIDEAAAYRILLLKQKTGVYQPTLFSSPFYKAVEIYLSEVNSRDQFVPAELERIQELLKKIDELTEKRLYSLKSSFDYDLSQRRLKLKLDSRNIWRSTFSSTESKKILDLLFEIKENAENYALIELETDQQRSLLAALDNRYEELVSLASQISYNIRLPEPIRYVDLNDEAHTRYELKEPFPYIPAGHLLGQTDAQVQEWVRLLKLSVRP